MTVENVLYITGLCLVILYLVLGVDDFLWDIANLFRRRYHPDKLLDIQKLESVPPKLLAIMVAAWHEENVLGDVIDNIIASSQYPKSMYHIFLGIYPNDSATLAVAKDLAERHFNVHVVVNCEAGPTSKAQNINHMIRQIKLFERERNWRFASMTIHDSEDVVHPYEFKVTNYLLDFHKVMQFPVFPLIKKPTFRNFFANVTTGTYADEFAEHHFIGMINRRDAGALVPSAGTGFVLSRDIIESFGDEDVLPKNSLTEDYRLSLTFFKRGIRAYYVLERVPRLTEKNKLVWDFIATRSMFPNTFKTAVRQKCRWVLGITMQSLKFKDIFTKEKIGFVGRYSLYKDLKPKVGNLLCFVGYPVLIYFLVSLFFPWLPPVYPMFSLSWYLCLAVTVMMLERQIFRAVAIYNVYGKRSVFFACLFPPIIPVRFFWGNLLNLVATIKAYKQNIFGNQKKEPKGKAPKEKKEKQFAIKAAGEKKLAWAKTDHSFLEKDILKRYHRKLGDVLLEKGYVTPRQLEEALGAVDENTLMGNHLLAQGTITENQLLTALAKVKLIPYVETSSISAYPLYRFSRFFDESLMRELRSVPLLRTEAGFVIAFCDGSPMNAQMILRKKYGIGVHAAFMSESDVWNALDMMYRPSAHPQLHSPVFATYDLGYINYEQAIIALNYRELLGISDADILKRMGLLEQEVALPEFLEDEIDLPEPLEDEMEMEMVAGG